MRSDLPSGTVTFLFTDVEGSTKLLHELGAEAYADALVEHRRVIREACAAHAGVEVDTQGDAFFFAFPTAPGALAAAGEMTEALAAGPIRVRVGLHTGTPLVTEEGYVAGDVHRAARIAAACHGGQVLVSASTATLVELDLFDLGEHRFKDLAAPERVFQFGDGDFPALKSLYRTNLPVPATPFLGRERELAEVVELLAREDVRLLTLTGPGGTGKTRLALQAAAEASDRYPDGIFWVPLAPLRDSSLILSSVAQALEFSEQPGRELVETLLSQLAGKRLLIVMDNLEHLLPAGAEPVAALGNAHGSVLLVTSRERLRIQGEQSYPVPSLTEKDGAALFSARARAVDPSFSASPAVGELCARLDELPLALELAAARTALFSPEQLLERLSERLDLLRGERDADPRQQTLRATIGWSYDLLDPEEQRLFRSLSVFAGGCTYKAAEQVAGADPDTLQSLLDKSLLRKRDAEREPRYWMLETIREYAAELLTESGERQVLQDGHLTFHLELAEETEPKLTGPDQRRWYDLLALEQDNVREAFTYACDVGDGERALMLAGTIWRFWWTRGQVAEASHWYERALALADNASLAARARGVFGAAHVTEMRGNTEQTRVEFEEAARLFRQIGDTRWLVLALTHLASAHHYLGDAPQAESVNNEALALALRSGDVRGAAIVRANLGYNLLLEGEDSRAAVLLEDALEGQRAIGDVYGIAASLANLAALALRGGDVGVAAARLRESLPLSVSIGDAHSIAGALSVAAALAVARGDARAGATLCAAGEASCSAHGFELNPLERQLMDEAVRKVRGALGGGFDDAWAAGANLDLDAAVELALRALD